MIARPTDGVALHGTAPPLSARYALKALSAPTAAGQLQYISRLRAAVRVDRHAYRVRLLPRRNAVLAPSNLVRPAHSSARA